MIVYISGPITGNPGYRLDFTEAARTLTRMGHEVINPVDFVEFLPTSIRGDLMKGYGGSRYIYNVLRVEMRLIDLVDAVVLLPGWEHSHGANLEKNRAINKGKLVYTLEGGTLNRVMI